MLFDTHVHFDGLPAGTDIRSVLERAPDVSAMIAVGGSPDANMQAVDLARDHPRRVRAAVGYGRHRAGLRDSITTLRSCLNAPGVVAIGETGLDLYHDGRTKDAQRALFIRMLETAREYGLPAIVHSRDAEELTLDILQEYDGPGVLHCFTGSRNFAERLLELGFFISFSGIITFKNADSLRETAAAVPDDRLLVETDSPYLAPEPHRGKSNEPALVRHVAEALAAIRKCSFDEIACITARNAEKLFHEKTQGDRH